MRRREFITLLGGTTAWPLATHAQQPARPRRVAVVNVLAAADPETPLRTAAFEKALRDLGWATELDITIDYYWNASDVARTRALAKQVVETRPDLVVTVSTPATKAIRDEDRDIPIVFVQVLDPVATGLVASLARPGGNITGFSNFEFSMGGKWLELLTEIAPQITNVALLMNPTTAPDAGKPYLRSIEPAALSLAIKFKPALVHNVDDIERMFSELGREQNLGLIIAPDVFTSRYRDLIVLLAGRNRLPALYCFRYFTTAGGLFSYGIDTVDLFRRAALYVDRILKGEKPGNLPVQLPTKFELVINAKTAKALGLTVPDKLLALADEVIE
jgi:putative ABC transport system substrate-binding protein